MAGWWEEQQGDPPGFVAWLRSINDYNASDPGEVWPGTRRWFRQFFLAEGPVSDEVVWRTYVAEQFALGRAAASAVLADLRRTTSVECSAVVEPDEWGSPRVGFWYSDPDNDARYGGFASDPMWEIEPAEVVAEVADEIQDQLLGVVVDGKWRCWPECRTHNAGLHAEAREGRAVWWCRPGQHELAPIGQLRASKSTP